ncbi:MAG: hypothetical protein KZQ88_07595 [Candidatus Thiodiazotropha sp. (ex Dulcina madagascariensis)]|nr:hypothetical protein [Candidatus Thiodiazotropha sp. (ex Dulcina madagascariensis)]MCU7925825.1 hypothetical protein [Candidatus Thiodiazotropha sp. (ex Dulcina madagascariensis)]
MHKYIKRQASQDRFVNQKTLNLRISGFSNQTIVSVDEILEALEALPASHLIGLREIAYDPNRVIQRAIGYYNTQDTPYPIPDFRSNGDYYHDERWINIYEFDSKQNLVHLLYHEVGHFVYKNNLSSVLRKRWVNNIYPVSSYVSTYAARNANEDFAESYAIYLLKPEVLYRIEKKYLFLKNQVFKQPT